VACVAQAAQSLLSFWLLGIVHCILLSKLQVCPCVYALRAETCRDAATICVRLQCTAPVFKIPVSRPSCSQATETGDECDSVNTGLSFVASALFLGCPLR
jgi:hypothetical protein